MKINAIFLDTSFFIHLFKPDHPHHEHAREYYRRFRDMGVKLYSSTIVAAEYGIKGNINHLPLRDITLLAFDMTHARLSATFARSAFDARRKGAIAIEKRVIIPNDTKLIATAQAAGADYFVARDGNAETVLQFLQGEGLVTSRFLDIAIPPATFFGELLKT